MHHGDKVIYYSPNFSLGGNEPLHAFIALGEIDDDEIVQAEMTPDFRPYRRKVTYRQSGMVKIGPLISHLQFILNKKSWGFAFRSGMIEIRQPDFERIEQAFAAAGNRSGDPS